MTWSSVIALPPTIAERTFLLVVSLDLSKSTSSLLLKNSTAVSCSRSCLEVGTVSTGSVPVIGVGSTSVSDGRVFLLLNVRNLLRLLLTGQMGKFHIS
jgi:hypothetical protein